MNKNIPIRQHFIPQFILRNFSEDDICVKYFDIKNDQVSNQNIKEVFMEKNLYNYKYENCKNEYQTEIDLSKFENIVSKIFVKLRDNNDIMLSKEEDEMLKLFLAIMGFRNLHTKNQFSNLTNYGKKLYSNYQYNDDFLQVWKRNLRYLVNSRTFNDVLNNDKIDDPIKYFIRRDIINLSGKYFVILEKRGQEKFIIGDCYPTVITGDFSFELYSYFPISPDRMLLFIVNEIDSVQDYVLEIDKKILKKPENHLNIPIRKIYDKDVQKINRTMIKNCIKGYISI